MGWFTDMIIDAQTNRELRKIEREYRERQRKIDEDMQRIRARDEERREQRRREEEAAKTRRLAAAKSDAEFGARELSSYKQGTVNFQLSAQRLREESAMRVSPDAMNDDVTARINRQISQEESSAASDMMKELELITGLMNKINSMKESA